MITFVRVVETHSFVAAAELLGMSQSGVSKAVSRLEQSLGVRLLNRTTRRLSLTEQGHGFYDRCSEALQHLTQAQSEVEKSRTVARGILSLNVPSSLGCKIIVPALPRFIEKHPELAVKIAMSDRALDLVQEGIDAVIQVGTLRNSSLVARRVGHLRGLTCASPDLIERIGCAPRTPADLEPEQCIAMFHPDRRQARPWIFRRGNEVHTLVPSAPLSFSDPESAVAAAVGGAGFVRTLDFTVETQIAAGLLQPVLAEWNEGATWPVWVLYPHRQPAVKIRAFVEFVTGLFADEGL
ncbi:LysR family transcriptional regulator [Peristeroidobacter soli]|uniref:LysR family transcriptional regulator n=1 Tax=Peristeroidobacter soli TaxID=2497877 RepID=UPI00101B6E41|nr:LysR family transcriptional regulator [Peristeroidobacter soli]